MTTKKTPNHPIISEKTDWGVKLRIHPFEGIGGSKNGAMAISADVQRPKSGRQADVRVWFSGVLGSSTLTQNETGMWVNALRGLLEEAKQVGAKMRPQAAKPKSRVSK